MSGAGGDEDMETYAMLLLAVLTAGSVAANFLELRHVLRLEKTLSEETARKKAKKN